MGLFPRFQASHGRIALDTIEAVERAHDVALPFEIALFDGVFEGERSELDTKAGHLGEVAGGHGATR